MINAAHLPFRRRAVVEELEQRILFSADFSPALLLPDEALPPAEIRHIDTQLDTAQSQTAALTHELIIVDADTPDYEKLVNGLLAQNTGNRQFDVVVLEADRDGIQQLNEIISGYQSLDAVHLISHGADGSIQLGGSRLDATSLMANAASIEQWRNAFSADADFLIYGCDVAASQQGQLLLDALSRLTGADVAASTNVTGSATLGGDWTLEYQVGAIETAVAPSAQAQASWMNLLAATPLGTEALVNTVTVNSQQDAATAVDVNGNFVVVWASLGGQDGSGSGIYAQRYDSTGVAQGAAFQVNTTTANDQSLPEVAMDDNGNFVVVWQSALQDGSGLGVYAQRYNAAGTAQGLEFRVNTYTTNAQSNAAVAMDSTGNFVVTWDSSGQDGSGLGVYAQRYNSSGVAQGAEFRVNTTTGGEQSNGSVGMDANGNFVVAWQNDDSFFFFGSGMNIYTQRYNAAGVAQGGEVMINTTTSGDQIFADVAMNASGAYVVGWQSNSTTWDIKAQRFNAAGTAQGAELAVNITTANAQEKVQVSMSDLGNFVVSWQSNLQDGGGYGAYLKEYTAAGAPDGGEVLINTTTALGQLGPAVAMDDAGNFVAAWQGNGAGDADGVFMRLFDGPNIAPALTLPGAALAWIEGDPATALDATATVTDIDSFNFSGGALTVDFTVNGSVDDRLAILNVGTGPGQIGVTGSNVTYGGVVIGSFSGGTSGASPLVVTFNLSATPSAAQALARNITFQNVSQAPSTLARTVRFVITDGAGGTSAAATKTVNVTSVNDAPVITSNGGGAAAAVSVAENTTAVTTVTSTDVDGPAPTYSISGGADAALFSINATTGVLSFVTAPNFEAPTDAGANNVYDVIVQVSDGSLTDTQALAVTVTNVNEAPVITSNGGGAAAAVSVAENTTAVTTVSSTDVDGGAPVYSITGGADVALFSINATTGALSFVTAPNFEAPTDAGANNVYDVIVQVSDGSLTDTQALAVTITNVNEAPVLTSNGGGASAATTVPENSTAVTTVTSTDVDGPAPTYSIFGGADAALFGINATTGVLSFVTAPNFEAPTDVGANNVYDVIVQVSDGSLTDTQALAVTVTNVNEAPVITSNGGGASAATSVAENSTAVTTVTSTDVDGPSTTYSISGGADAALFSINATTGALSFVTAPNFETPTDAGANNVYDVIVQVSDGSLTDTQALAVTVTNVNEAPVITSNGGGASAATSVAENSTTITTVTSTDVDGGAPVYSITGGADAALFSINATTGVLSFTTAPNFEAPTDAGANNVYDLIVQVSDGALTDTQALAVTVTNVNDAPIITSNGGGASAATSVAENTTAVTTVTSTDVDGGAPVYSITGGADAALFSINATTGVLTFVTAPNFEAPTDAGVNNVYDVIVQVSDGSLTDTQALAVTITNVNEAPVITSNGGGASAATSVAENTTAVTTVTSTDVDGGAPVYSITGGADAALFSINATTGALSFVTAPNFEAPTDAGANNVYDVIVQVSDGSLTDTQALAVTVTNVNDAPIITSNGGGASGAASVAENSSAVTTVTSTDVDGGAPVYSITGGTDAALFSINATTGALSFVTAPNFEAPTDAGANNVYDVIVQVSDGSLTDTQALAVTVTNANEAPAGTNGPVTTSENVAYTLTIADFGFTDPDAGDTLSAVRIDTLPAVGSLTLLGVGVNPGDVIVAADITAGNLVFTPALNANGSPYATFNFSVRDSGGLFDPSPNTLTVNVTAVNNPPVITSNGGGASAATSVAENSTAVTTVTSTDVDGPAPTYSISGGADAALFSINATTGVLTFVTAPNFEAPTDAGVNNVYDVIVQVSDGSLTDTQALAVTITNVNEAPVITSNGGGASAATSVAENTTAVTTVTSTDVDGGAPVYSITGGADAALFSINATTGALSFVTAPNFEAPTDAGANNVYDVIVQVSDGSLTDTQALAVSVTNVNDVPPVITSNGGGASAAVSVLENSTGVTTVTSTDVDGPAPTYSLAGGADAALFTMNATTGVLTFVTAPNFEAPTDAGANNVYDVIVQVSDGSLTDTQALAVTVTDVNEAPVITSNGGGASAATSVPENSTAVTSVTSTDVDGPAPTYSISGGADAALFSINATTGVLSFVAAPNFEAPTDAGANNVYDVTVQVSDGSLTDTQALAVTVTDVNEAPVITSNGGGAAAAVSVAENTTAVTTVTSTDVDGPAPTYSISGGADAALFTINATTGALSFVAAPNFEAPTDAGANNVYDVIVQVSDGSLTDTQALAVTVTNVNEAPVITSNGGGAAAAVSVTENTTGVTTVTSTDVDGPAPTYSISGGADAALFSINATTGALSFVTAPNFEAPTDAGANNVYDVIVQVSDGSLTDTQALAVTVTNVNEAPVITSNGGGAAAAVSVAENTTAVTTVTSTDVDGGTPVYSITGGADAALFSINATTGVLSFTTAPNFEAPTDVGANNVYDLIVQVSDGALTDTQALAVTVTNVNEAPVITSNGGGASAATSIGENTTGVTTVTSTDVDGPAPTYSISGGADAALFSINATTGALSFVTAPNFEAPTDAGANNVYDVIVQVSDGSLTDTQALAVTVTNVNEAPVITSNGGGAAAAVSVAENTTAVTTVSSTDVDGGAPVYSITGGADVALFSINATTGALSFVTAPNFEAPTDAGANNVYDVIVQVSDGSLTDTQALAVTVTNVNEAPVWTTSIAFTDNEALPVVETMTASDVDGDPLIWSILGGADATFFTINTSTGVLQMTIVPDFENPLDANADNVYEVTIQVSDGNGGTLVQPIQLAVANVQDAGQLTTGGEGQGGGNIEIAKPPPLPLEEAVVVQAQVEAQSKATAIGSLAKKEEATIENTAMESVRRRISTAFMGVSYQNPTTNVDDADVPRLDLDALLNTMTNRNQSEDAELSLTRFPSQKPLNDDNEMVWRIAQASTVGLSLGALWWLVQTGGLLSAVLATMPVWRNLDTLPILGPSDDDEEEGTDAESSDTEQSDVTYMFDAGDVR